MKKMNKKPMISHTEEFALRADLRAIEQKLFQLRYKALDYTIGNPVEVLAKIASVQSQLDELASNVRDQIDPERIKTRSRPHKHTGKCDCDDCKAYRAHATMTEASKYAMPYVPITSPKDTYKRD
jgi:hypothetical protein